MDNYWDVHFSLINWWSLSVCFVIYIYTLYIYIYILFAGFVSRTRIEYAEVIIIARSKFESSCHRRDREWFINRKQRRSDRRARPLRIFNKIAGQEHRRRCFSLLEQEERRERVMRSKRRDLALREREKATVATDASHDRMRVSLCKFSLNPAKPEHSIVNAFFNFRRARRPLIFDSSESMVGRESNRICWAVRKIHSRSDYGDTFLDFVCFCVYTLVHVVNKWCNSWAVEWTGITVCVPFSTKMMKCVSCDLSSLCVYNVE